MKRLLSCEFNMDTACVELKFANGSMIAIDTIAVENEVADNISAVRAGLADLQRSGSLCRFSSQRRPGNIPENCYRI